MTATLEFKRAEAMTRAIAGSWTGAPRPRRVASRNADAARHDSPNPSPRWHACAAIRTLFG
jgi:hypothetical protein